MSTELTRSSSASSLSGSHAIDGKPIKPPTKPRTKRQPQRPRTPEREGAIKRLRARYPELDRLYQREQELEETVAKKRWIAVPDLGRRHPDDARTEKFFPHHHPPKTRLVIEGQEELERVREEIQREVFMEICKSPLMPSWEREGASQPASGEGGVVPLVPRKRPPKTSLKTPTKPGHDRKIAGGVDKVSGSLDIVPGGGERSTRQGLVTSGRKRKSERVPELAAHERGTPGAIVLVARPVPSSPPTGNGVQQPGPDTSAAASVGARSGQSSSHRSRSGKPTSSESPLPRLQALAGTLAEKLFATSSQSVPANEASAPGNRRSGIEGRTTQSQGARSSRASESGRAAAAEKAAERAHMLQLLGRLKVPDTVTLDWMPERIARIQIGYQHAPTPSSDDLSELRAQVINSHWNFHAQAALQALADCYGNFIKQFRNNAAGMSNGPLLGALNNAMRDAEQRSATEIAAQLTQEEQQLLFPSWVGTAHLNPLQKMFEFAPAKYTDLFDEQGMVRLSLKPDEVVRILQKRVAEERKQIIAAYEEYRKSRGLIPNVPRAADGVR